MATEDVIKRYSCRNLIREIAQIAGGSGGGRQTWLRQEEKMYLRLMKLLVMQKKY